MAQGAIRTACRTKPLASTFTGKYQQYNMRTNVLLALALPLLALAMYGCGGAQAQPNTIEWLTLPEAVERAKTDPRPILVDLYTDWCGYCKRLDAYTFSNKGIAEFIGTKYYAVKFNAEQHDSVEFRGTKYGPSSEGRGPHELAVALTGGKLSYPTIVYLDATGSLITAVPGYYSPTQIEPILHYIATEAYKTQDWETFNGSFKSKL